MERIRNSFESYPKFFYPIFLYLCVYTAFDAINLVPLLNVLSFLFFGNFSVSIESIRNKAAKKRKKKFHDIACILVLYNFFFGMLQTMQGEDEVSGDFRLKINNNNEVRKRKGKRKKCKNCICLLCLNLLYLHKEVRNSLLNNIHDDF